MIYKATATNIPIVLGTSGIIPLVTISKDSSPFAPPIGTITEIGSGWYNLSLTSLDMDANHVAVHIEATNFLPVNLLISTESDYTLSRATKLDFLDSSVSGVPIATWAIAPYEIVVSGIISSPVARFS